MSASDVRGILIGMNSKKSIRCQKCGLFACKKHSKEQSDFDKEIDDIEYNERMAEEAHYFVEDDIQANKYNEDVAQQYDKIVSKLKKINLKK